MARRKDARRQAENGRSEHTGCGGVIVLALCRVLRLALLEVAGLGVPAESWFEHYSDGFDTVEINASFYSWPTVVSVQAWRRQAGKNKFVYSVKVCELITHARAFVPLNRFTSQERHGYYPSERRELDPVNGHPVL
jgi:hypothetical protein